MKKFLTLLLIFVFSKLNAQNSWTHEMKAARELIKNEGQFDAHVPDEKIEYGMRTTSEHLFFTKNKVHIHLRKVNPHTRTDDEIRKRAERKKEGFHSFEEWEKFQKEGRRFDLGTDVVVTEWLNSNPNVNIISEGESSVSYGYLMDVKKAKSIDGVKSYKKIIYQNIYPNIDIEYTINPIQGYKYSIIVHPGGNIADVQLKYSGDPKLLKNGTIVTDTKFGDIVESAPVTFYQGDEKEIIQSNYVVNDDIVSFSLGNYDSTRTAIIDPWVVTPTFATNWDCVWECETDAAGNVYFIGGADNLELRKLNSAGTAQWTYTTPYDTSSWLGVMVTDNSGNTYVTQGSTAAMIKVNTSGALVWSVGNVSGQFSGEFWNLTFNCDQTRIVTAGTGGGLPPQPFIYDINPANGSLISSIQVTNSAGLFSIEEVRAITATENEKYYWMTHDSIGYVSQILNICPSTSPLVKTNHGYNLNYKCENWRYNNTGVEALAYYSGYAYVNRGSLLDKRDFNTGASVGTATITSGAFASSAVQNCGIAIDNIGNIFVGSKGRIQKFNTTLTSLGTFTTSVAGCNIYDVAIGAGGEVIGAGSTGTSGTATRAGYVQSWAASASSPYAMVCCNASFCNPGPLCHTGPAVTLTPEVPGGTWSSTAPGFNATTGTFNPSITGPGTFTVTYTQPCGSSTMTISVYFCSPITVCRESNGNLTVIGGSSPYNWDIYLPASSTPITNSAECTGCAGQAYTWNGTSCKDGLFTVTTCDVTAGWYDYTSGSTVAPPTGATQIAVTDFMGSNYTFTDINALPLCSTPLSVELIRFNAVRTSEDKVELDWQTATETDNSMFVIHKSYDASDWKYVGQVPGSGTSSQSNFYSMIDPGKTKGVVYYRLSQIDFNGVMSIVSIRWVVGKPGDDMISEIFPNPASDMISFTLNNIDKNPLDISIYNALGQKVIHETISNPDQGQIIQIRLNGLPVAAYQLVIRQGDLIKTCKVIVQ